MTLYSTKSCPQCSFVKSMLKDKNIKFDVVDDIDVLREKGITTIPVLETDEHEMLMGKNLLQYVSKLK